MGDIVVDRDWKQDSRPARGSWAPGNYIIKACLKCGASFIGAKLARWCADCAYAEPEFAGILPGDVVLPAYDRLKQDADRIAERAHELSMLIRKAQDALRPVVNCTRIEYTDIAAFEPVKSLVVPWDEYERMKAACKIIQDAKL